MGVEVESVILPHSLFPTPSQHRRTGSTLPPKPASRDDSTTAPSMIAVVQRARDASVVVDGEKVGAIAAGMVILLGVACDDTSEHAAVLARKAAALRIFPDAAGVPNVSLAD